MAEKVILEVEVKSAKAGKDIKKVGDGSKAAAKETTILSMAMGGVKKAMLAMKATSKLLFGSITAGIASTGIGVLLLAFGALVTYFKNTKAGAEQLEVAFAAIGAAVAVITDRISSIGSAIAKVFSGDFKGAAEDVKGALSGIADEIQAEANAAINLKKAFNSLTDAQRDLRVRTAENKAEIEGLKIIAEDITKSDKERTEAAEKAFAKEKALMAERISIAEQALRIKQEENALGESMAEDLDAEADLLIELAAIKEESTAKQIGLQNFLNGIKQATRDKDKANSDARLAEIQAETDAKQAAADKQLAIDTKALEDKEALLLSEGERLLLIQQENAVLFTEDALERANIQLEFDRERALAGVADTEHSEALKAEINKKYNKKKQDQNKVTSEAERALNTGDLASVGSMLGSIAGLQNEGTDAWKTTKIAEARINTFIGAQAAFNSMITIPVVGQILAPIAAGIAILAGQRQVDAINATEIPKMARGGVVGGYGSGTSDSVNAKLSRGEVVINAKSAKMFRGALSNMNVAGGGVGFARGGATSEDTGEGLAGLSTAPIKAYVLTDSMSDSQAKLAKIRRRSKL